MTCCHALKIVRAKRVHDRSRCNCRLGFSSVSYGIRTIYESPDKRRAVEFTFKNASQNQSPALGLGAPQTSGPIPASPEDRPNSEHGCTRRYAGWYRLQPAAQRVWCH